MKVTQIIVKNSINVQRTETQSITNKTIKHKNAWNNIKRRKKSNKRKNHRWNQSKNMQTKGILVS